MTSTVTSTHLFDAATLTDETRRALEIAQAEYHRHVELDVLMESARADLVRLKLDAQGGPSRSPARLLEEAFAAIRVPPVPGGFPPALLALRNSIVDTIGELVRRRLTQDEAGKGPKRLLSIGLHCAKAGLTTDHFERLEQGYRILHDKLSGEGKGKVAGNADVVRRFHDGMTFLCTLLASLDETRLRQP